MYTATKTEALKELQFRAADHVYSLKGARLPSVTQAVDPFINFGYVPAEVLERARQRGNLVHSITAQWDLNPWAEDDPLEADVQEAALDGYLNGWNAFKQMYYVQLVAVEERCLNMKFRYSGTFDRVAWTWNKKTQQMELTVIDIKSGELSPEYAWQTAAYMHAYNEEQTGDKVTRRMVVQLREDGRWKVVEHTDPADFDAFVSALTIITWRMRYGKR